MKPFVELITTGNELLDGRSINRHAQTLGAALPSVGLQLIRDTTVLDDMPAMEEVIRAALEKVDVVVVTGGLGPTSDDVTRDVVAKILNRKMVMDSTSRQWIHDRYAQRKKPLNETVERHALVVEGAAVLANSAGLAPGERLEWKDKVLFLLPGPPREFHAVLTDHVLPWLEEKFSGQVRPLVKFVETAGIGESDILSRLEPLGFPEPGVEVAYCAMMGRVEMRLSAMPEKAAGLEVSMQKIREALKDDIYAEERIGLEEAVGRLLKERGLTLATAESCTGGLVGHRITSVSGSSEYYKGGIIAYSNDSKVRDLGVSADDVRRFGAVSEPVAKQMAIGVCKKMEADVGLSITGIAGPTGGTASKPVGLVYIGIADAKGRVLVKELRFAGGRDVIKEWSANVALDLLRRSLLRM